MREKLKRSDKIFQKFFKKLCPPRKKGLKSGRYKIQIKIMSEKQSSEITQILQDWNEGNEEAKERLLPFVYDELKRQARVLMSRERSNHTLQPTALVHEAFVRLADQS